MENHSEQHVVLSVELRYDLSECDDDNMLVIDNGDHHRSFRRLENPDHMHTITWRLTGNAIDGEFCALDDDEHPGFVWLIRKPDARVFHHLQLKGGKTLEIHNHHIDKSSEGTWYYQLFARFGDRVYGVPLTCVAGGANSPNPSIKNN
ncbi:hypothetical protein [Dyella humicola]|uniref:hypothetical protein n=1 Tax=Dyella humicola TaxID=2992126 RepID=UPI00224E91AD|nr:hypothetical protein [Dyella humicola]